jgi:hypothetical protein
MDEFALLPEATPALLFVLHAESFPESGSCFDA